MQIHRTSGPVVRSHGSAQHVVEAGLSCALSLPAKHLMDEQVGERGERIRTRGKQQPQFKRDAQDKLAHRHIWEYVVHNVGRAVVHSPCVAAWAGASLARQRYEDRPPTRLADTQHVTSAQDATVKILSELFLDVLGQTLVVLLAGLGKEGLQVLGDDSVQDGVFGLAPRVGPR
jgi:hypothetical protein